MTFVESIKSFFTWQLPSLELPGLSFGRAILDAGERFFYFSGIIAYGAVLNLRSAAALLVQRIALRYIGSSHHDMADWAYRPGRCVGGELFYDGDVPILSLEGTPRSQGYAQGYLCAEAIHQLTSKFLPSGTPMASRTLAEIRSRIPERYWQEIEGLVEGYQAWAKEQPSGVSPRPLTAEDILLLHMLPESSYPLCNLGRKSRVACCVAIERDEQGKIVFARNMDWESAGVFGTYSLAIHRKEANTLEIGAPGIIGTITGMNGHGLSIAMNTVDELIVEGSGLPALFCNRLCLESCSTVEEVKFFARQQFPMGAYHLSIADANDAASIHFYQSFSMSYLHHERTLKGNRPLVTLNHRYLQFGDPSKGDEEREEVLCQFFQNPHHPPLEDVLALSPVNRSDTVHRVVMVPATRTMKVAFGNGFAGSVSLHEIQTGRLFSSPDEGTGTIAESSEKVMQYTGPLIH